MIPKEQFGRTDHVSTRTLFGAAALANVTREEADRALGILLDYGVNHIDTAASYGDSELWLRPWLEQRRAEFFLATKSEERTYEGAWAELSRSLERLGVDSVDLWQMHLLVDPDEWEVAMGPGGALEAFVKARDEGLTRYLGVTGHGVNAPQMLRRSLEFFDFDSVLLPYNVPMMENDEYAAAFEALVEMCEERNVAVQTIKSIARRLWGDEESTRTTWYKPLETQEAIDTAVWWVLSRPGFFLNTAADVDLLPKVLDAASRLNEAPPREVLEAQLKALDLEPLFT